MHFFISIIHFFILSMKIVCGFLFIHLCTATLNFGIMKNFDFSVSLTILGITRSQEDSMNFNLVIHAIVSQLQYGCALWCQRKVLSRLILWMCCSSACKISHLLELIVPVGRNPMYIIPLAWLSVLKELSWICLLKQNLGDNIPY